MPDGVSLRRFARLIGVVPSAVVKAKARGVFSAQSLSLDLKGRPFIANAELAIAEWEASGRQLRVRRAAGEAVAPDPVSESPAPRQMDPSLVDVTRNTMLERQRKLRIANDLAEGRLMERTVAKAEAFEFARLVKETFLNLSPRLAAQLAAERDPARVFTLLDAAIREALTVVADGLERMEAA
jgi:hypothetical protein